MRRRRGHDGGSGLTPRSVEAAHGSRLLDDARGRRGSGDRHHDVRESVSQVGQTQGRCPRICTCMALAWALGVVPVGFGPAAAVSRRVVENSIISAPVWRWSRSKASSQSAVISGPARSTRGAKTAALHPGLAVDPRDVLVEKPRYSAFYGTEFGQVLSVQKVADRSLGRGSYLARELGRLPSVRAKPPRWRGRGSTAETRTTCRRPPRRTRCHWRRRVRSRPKRPGSCSTARCRVYRTLSGFGRRARQGR
jgi:hypothetical protein